MSHLKISYFEESSSHAVASPSSPQRHGSSGKVPIPVSNNSPNTDALSIVDVAINRALLDDFEERMVQKYEKQIEVAKIFESSQKCKDLLRVCK